MSETKTHTALMRRDPKARHIWRAYAWVPPGYELTRDEKRLLDAGELRLKPITIPVDAA